MGVLKTFWLRWDPEVEMAISEKQVRKALEKRSRLAPSPEKASLILRLVTPRPESADVSEEVEVISASSGRVLAVVNRKSDSWDEAVKVILDWVDGAAPLQEERKIP